MKKITVLLLVLVFLFSAYAETEETMVIGKVEAVNETLCEFAGVESKLYTTMQCIEDYGYLFGSDDSDITLLLVPTDGIVTGMVCTTTEKETAMLVMYSTLSILITEGRIAEVIELGNWFDTHTEEMETAFSTNTQYAEEYQNDDGSLVVDLVVIPRDEGAMMSVVANVFSEDELQQ